MADVSVTFAIGSEEATVVLPVDLPGGETILTGDIGGLVAAGTTARLRGNCRLIADLHVRGTLLCDPTGVDLDGQNLFDIHTHDGTLNLVGVEKSGWVRWGEPVTGWVVGDRLAVAHTAAGKFGAAETTWTGDWSTMSRPTDCPDVTLFNGDVMRPEVANLSQTVTLRNLKRVMVHEATAPNPQTFKWIRLLNCGESGVLGMYPLHFHQIYDHSRGSVIHGVVVEGGKNHAFVPHGSHGITQTDCVAYKTIGVAYWWDLPIPGLNPRDETSDTHDLVWDHCLALVTANSTAPGESLRLAGFWLGSGRRVSCINSVAAGITGGSSKSGFNWPEAASMEPWVFQNCLAHNMRAGIFVWQNTFAVHIVEDFKSYNCTAAGIDHGSYANSYQYLRAVIDGPAVIQHAKSRTFNPQTQFLTFEDIETNGGLVVLQHNSDSMAPTIFRRVTFSNVRYAEPVTGANGSYNIFEDCGLSPTDFDMAVSNPASIIEILENGILVHRWANGTWL